MSNPTAATATLPDHPFNRLNHDQKRSITAAVVAQLRGFQKTSYAEALQALVGKTDPGKLSKEASQAFNALNIAAQKTLTVTSWKGGRPFLTNLGPLLKIGNKVVFAGGVATAGIGLFYAPSHKFLALANGCAACAFWILSSRCTLITDAVGQFSQIIENLTSENLNQFPDQIKEVYAGLEKSLFIGSYLQTHRRKIRCEEHEKSLILFKEQLSAIQYLHNLIVANSEKLLSLTISAMHSPIGFLSSALFPEKKNLKSITAADIPPKDLEEIKTFFQNFDKLCRSHQLKAAGVGVLALAWTYYTYVQRVYLMIVAGVVHCIAFFLLAKELYVFQRGSKKIVAASSQEVVQEFRAMAANSSLLSLMSLQEAQASEIKNYVVIQFDAILNLLPSWKELKNRAS